MKKNDKKILQKKFTIKYLLVSSLSIMNKKN
jgi:hypothetical protein